MTGTEVSSVKGRAWSLQARLMVAIIGIVALIIVGIAIAISAFLTQILQDNLTAKVTETAQETLQVVASLQGRHPLEGRTVTADEVLTAGRQEPGVMLVLSSGSGPTSGAVVGSDGTVEELSAQQVSDVAGDVTHPGSSSISVEGLGEYRVYAYQWQNYVAIVGLPLSDVQSTIAKIFAAVLGISAIGLLVLAIAIALIVRAGLRPLRAVAETATRVANVPMAAGAVSITERVPDAEADPRTEIGRVGHALNTLLDHVDASLDARQHNEERMRRFVADASHELRTPLASIRGYSELSLRGLRMAREARAAEEPYEDAGDAAPTAEDPTEQSLERIQAQSLRMTTLVEDLLLLARLDEGQELVYGTVDLTRLAIEAVGDAQPAGPDHAWVLDVGEVPVIIAGDAARLHQVAANLLANASTHTPAGTTVTVSVERDGTDALLRVRDDGPGIDPAVHDELFERFSRADRSRARKTGGTGLGLSIARAIVDAHSGSISVTSAPGDTVFEVRLPARPEDPAATDQ